MTPLQQVVEVFWDGCQDGDFKLANFEKWLVENGQSRSSAHTPWIRAWMRLIALICRNKGLKPVIFVRDDYDFVGELGEHRLSQDMIARTMVWVHGAVEAGDDKYDVEPSNPIHGFVGTPQGVGFVWKRARHSSWWGGSAVELAVRDLWPSQPPNRFFNHMGGKKIEKRFFEEVPELARDAESAMKYVLSRRFGHIDPHWGIDLSVL